MSLSSPFLAGVTYTVSFYDRGCTNWVPYPFDLGISNDSTTFGTSILNGTQIPVDGVWTQRTVTFTAPFTASYLTVLMNGGGLGDWAHTDNFCINNCSVIPTAMFTAPNHICPGTCTNFTNLSQNGLSYLWSFPGANPSVSTDINPANICYNTPGNYAVSLIVNGATTSDTLTLNSYITVYPFPSPQGIMQGGDTLFANQGAVSYQWFYNGNIIPGATEYFYVAPQSGNFNVVATDINGCEVEAVIFDVTASVHNISAAEEAWVMPNPFTGEIRVMLTGKLTMFDNIGQKIFEKEIIDPQQAVDLSAFPKGIYFLQLESKGKILQQKMTKM
jgi:PKD repeat protein